MPSNSAGSGATSVTSTAVIGDNKVVRGDGGVRGIQDSAVTIDDSGNVTGVASLTATSITDSGLTSGRVVIASTGGLLADDADLTFATDTLTGTNITVSTNLTSPNLKSPAGSDEAISATAPAAANGASQAGKAVTVTASNAVASLDTAGAAAGGSVTITAGNAARLTSGNASGGSINLVTGAGIGTGVAGNVVVPAGGATTAGLTFSGAGVNTGFGSNGANDVRLWTNGGTEVTVASGVFSYLFRSGNTLMRMQSGDFTVASGQVINWSNATNSVTTADTGFARTAAGVIKATNGSSGSGWIQNTAGSLRVNADATNATATMSNLTDLTATLVAGRKYAFKLILYCADSVAAEGIKVDFDGGTATMTSFRAHGTIFDTALLLSTQTTAIATDFAVATVTGDSMIEIHGGMVVNAAGTFIPRFSQNTHATGTATVYLNSHLLIEDIP